MFQSAIESALAKLNANSLTRYRPDITKTIGSYHYIQNQPYLSFSTNDYLGLSSHPHVIAACQRALTTYGVGSGSAYLISGYSAPHRDLEEALADFIGAPRVLLFSCGFMANLGIISGLFSKQDDIFVDKFSHASVIDGCRLSRANFRRYPHLQIKRLATWCESSKADRKLIATEGLFSMDGTIAPLDRLCALAKEQRAFVFLDDAHGIGVLGNSGRGTLEHFGLSSASVTLLVGTLGKAFGTYGAFVAADPLIIEALIQKARTYLYTTAIPPAIAAASMASLQCIQTESWRRTQLHDLIQYFQRCAHQLNLDCPNVKGPIQPIIVGSCEKALKICEYLFSHGIYVKAIRPPTVPTGTARLRITLTVNHTRDDIDKLLECLHAAI